MEIHKSTEVYDTEFVCLEMDLPDNETLIVSISQFDDTIYHHTWIKW